MSNTKIFCIFLLSLIFLTGCDDSKVKVLEENFLDTKLGTIENQKLVVTLPEEIDITPKLDEELVSVSEKKQRFKDILVPISQLVYNQLEKQYQSVKRDIEMNKNREYIELLKKEYKAKTDETLLHALKPHPISILLAQAAAESAWLTSRFTKEAYNIFGVWSFNDKEPRIAASGLRGTKTIYLKKYRTLKAAVEDYYKNIGRNWAYSEFRKQRTLTNDPYTLSDYLGSYSEKKEAYTQLLKSMIKYNEFHKYDIKSDLN
ncbi:MAG: glucosaminidase domain-containing protein [Arcobacteraceae bacterium]